MRTMFHSHPTALRLALLLLCLALSGCRQSASPQEGAGIDAYPRRIVSLVPSATELLHAVGAADRLVGVTLNDNYPPEVALLPKVGDQTVDLEKVVGLEPDLVILDSGFNQNKQSFQRLGIQVLELRCERLDDVPEAMLALGRALGTETRARREAETFRSSLAGVEKLNLEESVFVEIWGQPLMTVGSETLVGDVLNLLGLENAYADMEGYFQVDPEDVLSRRPGVVILPVKPGDKLESRALELLQKTGSEPVVVRVDPDLLVRPGPRLLDGVENLKNVLERID